MTESTLTHPSQNEMPPIPTLQVRPRFGLWVQSSSEDTLNCLKHNLDHYQGVLTGVFVKRFATVKFNEAHTKFWSPELGLQLEEQDGGTLIRALFGPKSTIWTMFASFYAFTIFMGLIGLAFGYSQWTIGESPWGFWFLLASFVLFISAYLIAFIGQKLSKVQMQELRNFLNQSLEVLEPVDKPL